MNGWYVAFWEDHCLAFMFDGAAGVWVIVDPRWGRTSVRPVLSAKFDRWLRMVKRTASILYVGPPGAGLPVQIGFPCVAQVKRLIGSRSGALLPGGLRRDLLRSGARQAFVR